MAPRLAPWPQGLSQAGLQHRLILRLDWAGTRFQATHVASTGLGSSWVLGFLLCLGQRPSSPLVPWACARTAPTGRPTPQNNGQAEPGVQPVAAPMCSPCHHVLLVRSRSRGPGGPAHPEIPPKARWLEGKPQLCLQNEELLRNGVGLGHVQVGGFPEAFSPHRHCSCRTGHGGHASALQPGPRAAVGGWGDSLQR